MPRAEKAIFPKAGKNTHVDMFSFVLERTRARAPDTEIRHPQHSHFAGPGSPFSGAPVGRRDRKEERDDRSTLE